ncbi:ABC-type sugar transport system, substrate-binding protein, contains N-terminal xre family HTH domain [Sporobacter termitidis DSM 10068]|uniref:ABC-type sugar transport system, substrate-binding protein, contains N-terminal xre family HTH domain n=1 Tax=Sporobacter termitidis DSM 10068 TaxID=1123282 RepID=A0A1M5UJV4_9FIRM|nr:substrate-binding domain-containing protein [Sporobacter termitidis]SHH62943.1 ABC-type sugar transport system, substrate-binding protein, contains N-terminal xre family HTH domain [Sporobacter termitidis DSM 10068]
MKKLLAIILAAFMALSLFACQGGTSGGDASPAGDSPSAAAPSGNTAAVNPETTQANTGKTGDQPMDKVGFFDPSFDYAGGKKFKVQYMVSVTSPLYDQFSSAFAFWAGKMNIDYSPLWAAGGDSDAFLNNLQTFIKQGVNGFLLDPDPAIFDRVAEIVTEANVAWMSCMAPAQTDGTKPLLAPYVGFDQVWFGQQMALKLIDYMNTTWKDVDKSEIGYIAVDYSLAGTLHDREIGAEQVWKDKGNSPDNFFVADTATVGPTMDGANTTVTAILSAEPQYTHWLISAMFDDAAMGAAAALDTMGLTDDACVVTVGGTSLQRQWDAGNQDAWRFAMFTPQTIYAEPIIGALYAFMSGQTTPEEIWPSWVDHSKTDKYARLLLPSYWMDHDNYQKLLEWSDVYAGSSEYNYDAAGIAKDAFNARMDIPDSYAG